MVNDDARYPEAKKYRDEAEAAARMDIKKLIKEAHNNAVERGFYLEGEEKNIGELLMLIVSELGEALEAHRNNRFADKDWLDKLVNWNSNNESIKLAAFNTYIKDTFEDEIADVFIRLFDLCGYLDKTIKPDYGKFYFHGWTNIGSDFLMICDQLIKKDFTFVFNLLHGFCRFHNIPIEKHIKAKMAYNRTRSHKHGKEY